MDPQTQELIARLQLQPHPEGGYYRETFRAPFPVIGASGGSRAASTAIYFLLPAGAFSAFHRVQSDEVWHHYRGDTVELHRIDPDGRHELIRLNEETPQAVIPAGAWQAAAVEGSRYALCGCTVAPGFDFADFEIPPRGTLLDLFPQHRELIGRLTR